MQEREAITPPSSWHDPEAHFSAAAASPWYRMISLMNASIVEQTADFYRGRGAAPVLMPVTVGSVSSPMGLGSDSLPVSIELMGADTYLADSMQFQLEFMLRHGFRGVYYIMPTFRGESADKTHLNQFFHSEAEITGGLDDVMALVEDYLRHLTRGLLASDAIAMIADAAGTVQHLELFAKQDAVPRVSFSEARDLLGPKAFAALADGVEGITRAGELELIAHFGGAVWLTHPPHLSVPFYQRSDDRGRAQAADLLMGVGEIVGCGARHISGADVRASLAAHGVDEREYEWYVRMKDEHPLETAGFGLGVERFLLWVLGHDDIRDLHVMPRIAGHRSWL